MLEINKIYNEDCLLSLSKIDSNMVDLCIADPPYYKIVKEAWDVQWKTEKEYIEWSLCWIKEVYRVLKSTGSFYIYGGIGKNKEHPFLKLLFECEDIGFIFQDWITWKKQRGLGSKKGYMFIREELLFLTKSKIFTMNMPYTDAIAENHGRLKKGRINHKRCGNVWTDINEVMVGNNFRTERVDHPTQKPLKMSERIITTSTNKNDLIYIPFAGSGSEIISCIKNDRNYIGSEINEYYVNQVIPKNIQKHC